MSIFLMRKFEKCPTRRTTSQEFSDKKILPGFHFYNAVMIECEDLTKAIRAIRLLAINGSLEIEKINTFYDWFEGFFAILTALFNVEENLVCAYLQRVGLFLPVFAYTRKRRNVKKVRAKDLCYDILELKIRLDEHPDSNRSYDEFTFELSDEAHHLLHRISHYAWWMREELNRGVRETCSKDETAMIFNASMESLRKTDGGKLTICAMTRAIKTGEERKKFRMNLKDGTEENLDLWFRKYEELQHQFSSHLEVLSSVFLKIKSEEATAHCVTISKAKHMRHEIGD